MDNYYVYACSVDGIIRYVGMGHKNRYKHCTSGKSSCAELNRDFFDGKRLATHLLHENLSQEDAAIKEEKLIQAIGKKNLYNIKQNPKIIKRSDIKQMAIDSIIEISNSLPQSIHKPQLETLINKISKKYNYPARDLSSKASLKPFMEILGYKQDKKRGSVIFEKKSPINTDSLINYLSIVLAFEKNK